MAIAVPSVGTGVARKVFYADVGQIDLARGCTMFARIANLDTAEDAYGMTVTDLALTERVHMGDDDSTGPQLTEIATAGYSVSVDASNGGGMVQGVLLPMCGGFSTNRQRMSVLDIVGAFQTFENTDNWTGVFTTSIERLWVGGIPIATSAQANSYIADAAFWHAYLSEAEHEALVRGANPLTIRRNALIGYWPLAREYGWSTNLANPAIGLHMDPSYTLAYGRDALNDDQMSVIAPRGKLPHSLAYASTAGAVRSKALFMA